MLSGEFRNSATENRRSGSDSSERREISRGWTRRGYGLRRRCRKRKNATRSAEWRYNSGAIRRTGYGGTVSSRRMKRRDCGLRRNESRRQGVSLRGGSSSRSRGLSKIRRNSYGSSRWKNRCSWKEGRGNRPLRNTSVN